MSEMKDSILVKLTLDLEQRLKDVRKSRANMLQLFTDADIQIVRAVQQETIKKHEETIVLYENCYRLAVMALKHPDLSEKFESMSNEQLSSLFGLSNDTIEHTK